MKEYKSEGIWNYIQKNPDSVTKLDWGNIQPSKIEARINEIIEEDKRRVRAYRWKRFWEWFWILINPITLAIAIPPLIGRLLQNKKG